MKDIISYCAERRDTINTLTCLAREVGLNCNPDRLRDALENPNFADKLMVCISRAACEQRSNQRYYDRSPFMVVWGGRNSIDELLSSLSEQKHHIGETALAVICESELRPSVTVRPWYIYYATVQELTGKTQTNTADILRARERYGFGDAPDDIGLLVRAVYRDQPENESLNVVGRRIKGPWVNLEVFLTVTGPRRNDPGLSIQVRRANDDAVWEGAEQLLLVRDSPINT